MALDRWRKIALSPLDITLDRDNPRINVLSTDKESDIIRKLILYEEVIDLAKKIASFGVSPKKSC